MSKFLRVQSKRLYLKRTGREMQVPPRKPASYICIQKNKQTKKHFRMSKELHLHHFSLESKGHCGHMVLEKKIYGPQLRVA